jgi:hypothetical protein
MAFVYVTGLVLLIYSVVGNAFKFPLVRFQAQAIDLTGVIDQIKFISH